MTELPTCVLCGLSILPHEYRIKAWTTDGSGNTEDRDFLHLTHVGRPKEPEKEPEWGITSRTHGDDCEGCQVSTEHAIQSALYLREITGSWTYITAPGVSHVVSVVKR